MRQETINLYKFHELSEEAQRKAIEKLYDINTSHNWYEYTYEYIIETYGELFDIDRIYFRGFSSQGDGAMFEYSRIDSSLFEEAVNSLNISEGRKKLLINTCQVYGKGTHRGHYYHEKSIYHNIEVEPHEFTDLTHPNIYNFMELYAEDIVKYIVDKYEDICHELYNCLETDYYHLTSKEAIVETILTNEYEFTSDGELF